MNVGIPNIALQESRHLVEGTGAVEKLPILLIIERETVGQAPILVKIAGPVVTDKFALLPVRIATVSTRL
jgi:hypothetical protein